MKKIDGLAEKGGSVQWDPRRSLFFFFISPPPDSNSFSSISGFGAEREQLDEGAEERVQPTLVGHALLHHFLLARVLGRLLDRVGLRKGVDRKPETQVREQVSSARSETCELTSFLHCKKVWYL